MAGIGIAAINGFVVLLCIDRGFGQASGAIAIALFAFSTLVGRLVAGGLPDRLGPRRTMMIAVTLGGTGQLLIAVAPAWWAVGLGSHPVRHLLDAAVPSACDAGRRRGRAVDAVPAWPRTRASTSASASVRRCSG